MSIYVGSERIFGANFHVIPIFKKDESYKENLIGFGCVWNGQIVPIPGFEKYLIPMKIELCKEKPFIPWNY